MLFQLFVASYCLRTFLVIWTQCLTLHVKQLNSNHFTRISHAPEQLKSESVGTLYVLRITFGPWMMAALGFVHPWLRCSKTIDESQTHETNSSELYNAQTALWRLIIQIDGYVLLYVGSTPQSRLVANRDVITVFTFIAIKISDRQKANACRFPKWE